MEQVIQTGIEILLISIVLYLVFFRKFLSELGKQTAELAVIKKKTEEIESVKLSFQQQLEVFKNQIQLDLAKEIEPFKASLSKENITYQIYSTEYIRLCFQRLDDLHAKLYELKNYCQSSLFFYSDEPDFRSKREGFFEHYKIVEHALNRASLYIDDVVAVAVIDMLNEARNALQAFNTFYSTDPQRNSFIFNSQRQALVQRLLERNNDSLDRLTNSIDKLPELLRKVESEFKKHLIKK